jgi:hypothetical protein
VSEPAPTRVGALGSPYQGVVDAHGGFVPDGGGWQLDWWIGGDDRWHVPGRDAATRQRLVEGVPVVETAVRVPGGDAVHRVYGIGGASGVLAVEVENASPAPFVVAFVVHPADPDGRVQSLSVHGGWVVVDGRPILRTLQPARRWAVSRAGQLFDDVAGGEACTGQFPTTRDRSGRLEAAFLHPVAHRSKLHAVAALGPHVPASGAESDPARLPPHHQAALGWKAQLDRGMRVGLPDTRLQTALEAACAALLLSATARVRPTAAKVIALEDWGFDREAALVWKRLGVRDRHRAAQRPELSAPWPEVLDRLGEASPTFTWHDGPAPLLRAVRELLVREREDRSVRLLAQLPPAWFGESLDVHDAPTRSGAVSYAIRWHGERPALLWESPAGVRLSIPGLDPTWSTDAVRGEALLVATDRAAR